MDFSLTFDSSIQFSISFHFIQCPFSFHARLYLWVWNTMNFFESIFVVLSFSLRKLFGIHLVFHVFIAYVTYKSWGRQIHVLRIFVLVLHKARKGSCRWPMKTERATWIRDTRNRPEKERKRERENERFMVTWPLTAGSKIFCYALQCTFFQSYPHVTRTWFASQIGKKNPFRGGKIFEIFGIRVSWKVVFLDEILQRPWKISQGLRKWNSPVKICGRKFLPMDG